MPQRHPMFRDDAAKRDAIHRSLLTGLLGNVGKKTEGNEYQGARSIKFSIFPGSALFKAKPPWLLAAEIVETTRLYARTIAPINPEWMEHIAPHLLSRSYGEPYWDKRAARALTKMKLTYHGLTVVPARPIGFAEVDPTGARNLFIQYALLEGDIEGPTAHGRFLLHNFDLLNEIKAMEDKARRRDLIADAARLFAFYDVRVPVECSDGPHFERWRKDAEQANPKLLFMNREDVLGGDATDITPARYPDVFQVPGSIHRLQLRYRYEPGHPADGVTALVPVEALGSLSAWQFDRLVPGYVEEKVDALIRSLPKNLRTKFVPVPQFTAAALPHVATAHASAGLLTEALAKHLQVTHDSFNLAEIPLHLQFNFRVLDSRDKVIAVGRDLAQLRKELGVKARSVFAELPPSEWNREGLTRWDFGELPQKVDLKINNSVLPAYPALIDNGATVALKLLESPEAAYQATRGGLRRLFALQLAEEVTYLEKHIPGFEKMALYYRPLGTSSELKADILTAASERALETEPEEIRTKEQFVAHAQEGWRRLAPSATDISKIALEVLESRHRMDTQMTRVWPELLQPSVRDVQEQLTNLMPKRFLSATPQVWLPHLPRFMKAAEVRLNKLLNAGAGRDIDNLKLIRPMWKLYTDRARAHADQNIRDPELTTYRWMLEELRVSMFAQELKTSIPISLKRLEKQWELVRAAK